MIHHITNLKNKFRNKGFIGPKYKGISGKIRFIVQHFITHTENIYCYRHTFDLAEKYKNISRFRIERINSYKYARPYINIFEAAYYRGFTKDWGSFFSWGEELILAFHDERTVAFCWLQIGRSNAGTYCFPLFEGDYRILRAGVLPDDRGQNYQALMNIAVTKYLIQHRSANRIYAEVFIDNVPSCKSFEKADYQIIGIIRVWSLFMVCKPFIQWLTFFPTDKTELAPPI